MALSICSVAGLAHEFAKGDLMIAHPWARPTLTAKVPAGVFFDIINDGAEADRLIAVKTDLAKSAEIHVTETDENGVARMHMLKDGLAAPEHATTSLKPGSYHVMLIGLDAPLAVGQSFPATLIFEKAGDVEIVVTVESPGQKNKTEKTPHQH